MRVPSVYFRLCTYLTSDCLDPMIQNKTSCERRPRPDGGAGHGQFTNSSQSVKFAISIESVF